MTVQSGSAIAVVCLMGRTEPTYHRHTCNMVAVCKVSPTGLCCVVACCVLQVRGLAHPAHW
jgi:hypothetical protein